MEFWTYKEHENARKSYEFLVVLMLARLLESYQDIVVYVDNLDMDMKKKTQLAFWWIG